MSPSSRGVARVGRRLDRAHSRRSTCGSRRASRSYGCIGDAPRAPGGAPVSLHGTRTRRTRTRACAISAQRACPSHGVHRHARQSMRRRPQRRFRPMMCPCPCRTTRCTRRRDGGSRRRVGAAYPGPASGVRSIRDDPRGDQGGPSRYRGGARVRGRALPRVRPGHRPRRRSRRRHRRGRPNVRVYPRRATRLPRYVYGS